MTLGDPRQLLFLLLEWYFVVEVLILNIALLILLILKLAKLVVHELDDLRKLWNSRSARSGFPKEMGGASHAPRERMPDSVHDYCI